MVSFYNFRLGLIFCVLYVFLSGFFLQRLNFVFHSVLVCALPGKAAFEMKCVGQDIKPYSLTYSDFSLHIVCQNMLCMALCVVTKYCVHDSSGLLFLFCHCITGISQ